MGFMPKIESVCSKVVGCTFGHQIDGISVRQAAIEKLMKDHGPTGKGSVLELRREKDNEFDPDAIAVYCKLSIGFLALGYISNSDKSCLDCGKSIPKNKAGAQLVKCPSCNSENLLRKGLASELSEAMDEGFKYSVSIMQITGGGINSTGKRQSYGANIRIDRVKQ